MLRTLVQRSGVVLARTEKPGLGGSGGPACTELGYDEELAAHASALRALARSDWVHPDSIVIFGASMGGTMAPLLGRIHPVSGIIVWGTTGLTWAEHMLALDRRVLALRGVPPAQRKAQLDEQLRFHAQYLGEQRQPRAIVAATPALGAAWRRMLGTDTAFTSQYGRPVRFHHEAQRADWIAAWGDVADAATPVLIAYGEHDWIMGEAEHLAIKQLLDAIRPGCAASRRIAGASHGFEQVERPVLGGASGPFAREAADAVLQWLTDHRRTMHTARGCGRRS
jgi:pimeloyl-ACP methyl ester carboxylesterase